MTQQNSHIFLPANLGPAFMNEVKNAALNHLTMSVSGDGVLLAPDTATADITALQNLINAHDPQSEDPDAYMRQRALAYPAIGDQLDEIMKWIDTSTDTNIPQGLKDIAQSCMNVKTAHPKPQSGS